MKRLFVMVMLVLGFSQGSLWAQEVPSAEAFGGFSVLSIGGDGERFNPLGWQASVAVNPNSTFGIVGDFGGQYKDGASVYQFLGGVRGTARRDRTGIFAQAMAGGSRFGGGGFSETGFTMAFGGGIDVHTSGRIAIRVVQFDWLPSRFDGEWESNVIRFGFGIVIKGTPR